MTPADTATAPGSRPKNALSAHFLRTISSNQAPAWPLLSTNPKIGILVKYPG